MVKALILLTLLSWSASSVTIADVISESAIPSSRALEIRTATPTSIKRHLRTNVAITLIDELATTLRKSLPTAKLEELQPQPLSPIDLFAHMNLGQVDIDQLLENQNFFAWVSIVISHSKTSSETTSRAMFEALSSHYKSDDAVMKALLKQLKINDDSFGEKFAEYLLRGQIASWVEKGGKTPKEMFGLLKLDKVEKGELFDDPALSLWVESVNRKYFGPDAHESPRQVMFETLSSHYEGDDALTKALLERVKIEDASYGRKFAENLLHERIGGKTPKEMFGLLKLDKVEKGELFDDPALSLWVESVNRKYFGPDAHESPRQVMFETLSSHYGGDEALMKALLKRAKIKDARYGREFAQSLLLEESIRWAKQGGKKAERDV